MSENTPTAVEEDELVQSIIHDGNDSIIVNPPKSFVKPLIMAMSDHNTEGHVRILGSEDTLKAIRNDFILASKIVELINNGNVELSVTDEPQSSALIISDSRMSGIIDLESTVSLTETQDVNMEVNNAVESAWDSAEPFTLRKPALNTLYSTLEEDISEEASEDYQQIVEQFTANNTTDFDEVLAALVVAAKNNILLYDISKWGEDCGLASKATFSRTKTKMEDRGQIRTEKVPIDVGRPRLRLALTEEFENKPVTDVVAEVTRNKIEA